MVTGATFLVIGLVVCEFARQTSVRSYYHDLEQTAELLTSTITAASLNDIHTQNTFALEGIVTRLIDNVPDVRAVAIYDNQNEKLASWGEGIIEENIGGRSVSSYETTIEFEGENIGRIAVAFDVSATR